MDEPVQVIIIFLDRSGASEFTSTRLSASALKMQKVLNLEDQSCSLRFSRIKCF